MIKSKGRRITWFVLTLILAMGMIGSSVAFAAPAGDTSDRMQHSTNIGKITWQKTYNKSGTAWPDKDNFEYKVTRVRAWDNSNVSTGANGTDIAIGKMPLPVTGTKKTAAPYNCDDNSVIVEKVDVKTATGTATNPLVNEENVATGEVDSTFTFERPGYYLYKVEEIDDGVSGVIYDKHVYYLAFYVANKTQDNATDGDTLGGKYDGTNQDKSEKITVDGKEDSGLYIHTITLFRSATQAGTNPNDRTEEYIQSVVDPAWENGSVYYKRLTVTDENISSLTGTYYEQEGSAPNYTYKKIADNSTIKVGDVIWIEITPEEADQLVNMATETEKVARSTWEEGKYKPNELDVPFENETKSNDVEIEKRVTGTLGDLNKEFEFDVELQGLQKGQKYEITGAKAGVQDKAGTIIKENGKVYVQADNDGKASFVTKLKAKEKIAIVSLPVDKAEYRVTERSSDHQASYELIHTGATKAVDVCASDANVGKDKAMKTGLTKEAQAKMDENNAAYVEGFEPGDADYVFEKVDAGDGKTTVKFTNHRDFETETGIPNFVFPIVLAAMLALIGLAVMRRKNNVSSVNDFEF